MNTKIFTHAQSKNMAATNRSINIGFVLDDSLDKPDGVQQYVLALGAWLKKRGHNVHYLVGESSRTDVSNVHSLSRNLRVSFNKNRMSMPLLAPKSKLRAVLKANKFDVLHVQMPYSPIMAHKLINLADDSTAVFGTFHIAAHGRVASAGTKALGAWTRKSLKRFDKIFSVSEPAQVLAKKAFGVDSEVLPNTFDWELFNRTSPIKKYEDGRLTVLFLGRLVPRKGCLILLKAVAELVSHNDLPKFKVLICGKGPEADKLKKFVQKNRLQNDVEFVGFVSEADKPNYYASADISVFPSTGGESFGIVLIEAMASGRAAILAGDNSGYHSVMHEQPELLVPVADPKALAQKLAWLLKNEADRKSAAIWGAEYSKRFDIDVVGRRLEATYHAYCQKKLNNR